MLSRIHRHGVKRLSTAFQSTVKARWADAASIERVPLIAAGTEPLVSLCGATSRRVGSGCAAVLARRAFSLLEARGLE
jgi:hypothetical protein